MLLGMPRIHLSRLALLVFLTGSLAASAPAGTRFAEVLASVRQRRGAEAQTGPAAEASSGSEASAARPSPTASGDAAAASERAPATPGASARREAAPPPSSSGDDGAPALGQTSPAAPASGPPEDRLDFVSGDRVHGVLAWVRKGVVAFSAFMTKEVKASFTEVRGIETTGDYEVLLTDGSRLRGRLRPHRDAGMLVVASEIQETEVAAEDVTTVETVEAAEAARLAMREKGVVRLGKVWKGYMDLGYTESSGNTELRDVRVTAGATRKTRVDKLTLRAFTNRASTRSTVTAQRSQGEARLDVFLPRDLFYFYQTRIENDELRDLDLRTTLGVGLGKRLRTSPDYQLALGLGFSFVKENFTTIGNNSEGTLLFTTDLERRLSSTLSIEHHLTAYPEVGNGDLRLNAQTTLKSALTGDLSFTLGVLNKYDSDPPAGIEKSDVTVTTGLRKDF